MRLTGVVRVEENIAPRRTEGDRFVKITARCSFRSKSQIRTWSTSKKTWEKTHYSSLFLDFLAWKTKEGEDPAWLKHIVPGNILEVEGSVYQIMTDKEKYYTVMEITSASFPISALKDVAAPTTPADANKPAAKQVAVASAFDDDEEVMPF